MSDIGDILQSLTGQHIPGGCDDCNAYQTVHSQHGIYVINVCHDDTCPTWQQIQARRQATS